MPPFVSTIANASLQIWEALALMAVAAVPRALPRKKRRHVPLDAHTLKDIGIEPGSITWL